MARRKGFLVLVRRPRRWTPVSELDVPPEGLVVEIVDLRRIGDPATYLRQYNALSMDEAGTTWAALVPRRPEVGKLVELGRAACRNAAGTRRMRAT